MKRRGERHCLAAACVVVLVTSCDRGTVVGDGRDEEPHGGSPAWFVDVAAETGLDFVHASGVDGGYFMPEIMGSGGALFDYDNDGDLDVYLVSYGPPGDSQRTPASRNRLFRREATGRYTDVTATSGLGDDGYGMGTAVGDIDNDGDLDVYVTNYGDDSLYRNNGDGTFTDITSDAGIDAPRWSMSAAFLDYENDGYLDLFVVSYVTIDPERVCRDEAGRIEYCGPLHGVPDLLYRNNGDGTFTDVSRDSSIAHAAANGLGVVSADFDADGRLDVFVANDGDRNALWTYAGDGRFTDRALPMGVAVNLFGESEAGMGVAMGDVDGTLDLDLFLTHVRGETNTLYAGLDGRLLHDVTAASGLGAASLPYTGFGTGLFDLDHDGDLDLVVANGRIARGSDLTSASRRSLELAPHQLLYLQQYGEPNLLFENDGTGRFENVCQHAGELCSAVEVSRSLMSGDVDLDGDLDVLVTNSKAKARIFRNDVPAKGHWLMIKAIDPRLARDAVGAVVTVGLEDRQLIRPVTHTYSYLASTDASVHFGLGDADRAREILVRWPDGTRERFSGCPADRFLHIEKAGGRP